MDGLMNALGIVLSILVEDVAILPPPPPVAVESEMPDRPVVIVESPCAEQPADCHVDAETASAQK